VTYVHTGFQELVEHIYVEDHDYFSCMLHSIVCNYVTDLKNTPSSECELERP
jgi:hypothetical protein